MLSPADYHSCVPTLQALYNIDEDETIDVLSKHIISISAVIWQTILDNSLLKLLSIENIVTVNIFV